MAFNISNKRMPSPDIDSDNGNETTPTEKQSTVVATQKWVGHALDKFIAWTQNFRTNVLQVTGKAEIENLDVESTVTSDLIVRNKVVLLDDSGNRWTLKVKDGELKVDGDYDGIFLYAPNCDVRKLNLPDGIGIGDFLISRTTDEISSRFVKFNSSETSEYNGVECGKVSDSNINDWTNAMIDGVYTITPSVGKVVTGIAVADAEGNEISRVDIPDNLVGKMLAFNVPMITDPDSDLPVNFKLKSDTTTSDCNCGCHESEHHCHHTPIISPCPLDPSLFDDDEPVCCNRAADSSVSELIDTVPYEYCDYAGGDFYTITLKKGLFDINKKQFIVVLTK